MAGLATHLHYHEPSNYVLVSFLQRGLFHDLCQQPGLNGKNSFDTIYHAYSSFDSQIVDRMARGIFSTFPSPFLPFLFLFLPFSQIKHNRYLHALFKYINCVKFSFALLQANFLKTS